MEIFVIRSKKLQIDSLVIFIIPNVVNKSGTLATLVNGFSFDGFSFDSHYNKITRTAF